MIIVAGHLRVAAAERDAYLAAVQHVAGEARQAAGCHDFVQAADPVDPERINIFERWESDEDLLAYRSSGGDEFEAPDLLGADVAKYRIASVEAP